VAAAQIGGRVKNGDVFEWSGQAHACPTSTQIGQVVLSDGFGMRRHAGARECRIINKNHTTFDSFQAIDSIVRYCQFLALDKMYLKINRTVTKLLYTLGIACKTVSQAVRVLG
jgi:hypothetical protein